MSAVSLKPLLFMSSGAKMRSAMTSPSRLPVMPSTTWPTQSMLEPYSHSSPGSNRRGVERRLRRREHARLPALLGEAVVVLVEEVVAEARGVQEQHPGGDVAPGRAQPGLSLSIETLEHLQLADVRGIDLGRRIELEPAILDQLQRGGAGDRLGGRKDGEHGVGRHVGVAALHALAGRAIVDVFGTIGRDRDHAGDAGLTRRSPCAKCHRWNSADRPSWFSTPWCARPLAAARGGSMRTGCALDDWRDHRRIGSMDRRASTTRARSTVNRPAA